MQKCQQPVTAFFEADHDRLDCLFQKYSETKRQDIKKAKTYFREFLKGLQRHIIWEEEILFPFFEEVSGMTMGPTIVMRHEHKLISEMLDQIHERVRKGDTHTDEAEQALLAVLTPHNEKEENILYPAIDQYAGDGKAADLFLAMEEISDGDLGACCDSRGDF